MLSRNQGDQLTLINWYFNSSYPMFASYRNQSIILHSKSVNWVLYDRNHATGWVKRICRKKVFCLYFRLNSVHIPDDLQFWRVFMFFQCSNHSILISQGISHGNLSDLIPQKTTIWPKVTLWKKLNNSSNLIQKIMEIGHSSPYQGNNSEHMQKKDMAKHTEK